MKQSPNRNIGKCKLHKKVHIEIASLARNDKKKKKRGAGSSASQIYNDLFSQ